MDVREIVQFVSRLYRSSGFMPCEQFRTWALNELGKATRFDAAFWLVGQRNARGELLFDNALHLTLPAGFANLLGIAGRDDAIGALVAAAPTKRCGSGHFNISSQSAAAFTYSRMGVRSCMYAYYSQPSSGATNIVAVFGLHEELPASELERQLFEAMVVAIVEAASACFAGRMMRAITSPRSGYAICDSRGGIIEAPQAFRSLLQKHFVNWNGSHLPFLVSSSSRDAAPVSKGLLASVKPMEELFELKVWERTVLDQLTAREAQLVEKAAMGLTDKEIANQLGLAPSTVSNRLVSTFKKLAVGNRRELRQKFGINAERDATHDCLVSKVSTEDLCFRRGTNR